MEPTNQLTNFAAECKTFKQLLDTQTWVDCTLACEGGKISAHKVVLSACSSYLNKILNEHPVEHPIIILPELAIEDVRTLVHYMYTGELLQHTDTQHSASLLRTAAVLSVNSLNDFLSSRERGDSFLEDSDPTTNISSSSSSNSNNIGPNSELMSIQDGAMIGANNGNNGISGVDSNSNSINNSISLISNYSSNSSHNTSIGTSNASAISPGSNNNNNSTSQTGGWGGPGRVCNIGDVYNTNKNEFQFKCPVCQNNFQTICSFEYHMQRTHNVTSFGCEICHKPFASLRYVLTDHMRRCHGWKAEQKLQC